MFFELWGDCCGKFRQILLLLTSKVVGHSGPADILSILPFNWFPLLRHLFLSSSLQPLPHPTSRLLAACTFLLDHLLWPNSPSSAWSLVDERNHPRLHYQEWVMRGFGFSITGASPLLRGCPGDAPSLPDFPSSAERSLFQKFPEAGPGLGREGGRS